MRPAIGAGASCCRCPAQLGQVSAARREHAMRTNFGFGRFFQLVTRRRPASRLPHIADVRVRTSRRDAAKYSNSFRQCCRRLCRARGASLITLSTLSGARAAVFTHLRRIEASGRAVRLRIRVNRLVGQLQYFNIQTVDSKLLRSATYSGPLRALL